MRPIDSLGPIRIPTKPKLDPVTVAGRKALRDHVTQVLFDAKNPAGAQFRDACVAWRTPAEQKKFKNELLRQAANWDPASKGWEKGALDGKTVYSGRFGQLYTEVRFPQAKGAKPEVYVEID